MAARPALSDTPELSQISRDLMQAGLGPAFVMDFRWKQHKASIKELLEELMRMHCYQCAQNHPVILHNGKYWHHVSQEVFYRCTATILHKVGERHGLDFTTRI